MRKSDYIQMKVHEATKEEFRKRLKQEGYSGYTAAVAIAVEEKFDINLLKEYSNDTTN